MGWLRILFYVVGRVITALVAGFGLAWDYTGGSWLNVSSNDWGLIGLIALGVFVFLTITREIDWAFQQKPKAEIEVYPHFPVAKEVKLVVHNKTKIPVSISANMTCQTASEPVGGVSLSLMTAPLGWESSGSYKQEIEPDAKGLLKLCKIENTEDNGQAVHWVSFYKIESNKIISERFIGAVSDFKVEVLITLNTNLQIKGQREWLFNISLIPESSDLVIMPKKPTEISAFYKRAYQIK